ncbi:MAG: hypothetical protein WAT23_05300 [Chromatiaceae bacterium]
MRMMFALLLAVITLTAMAVTPVDAADTQLSEQAAGIKPAEQDRPSGYRGRFGRSAASRNAHHVSSQLGDGAPDGATKGCTDKSATPVPACEHGIP